MTLKNRAKLSVGTQREKRVVNLGHRRGRNPLVLRRHEVSRIRNLEMKTVRRSVVQLDDGNAIHSMWRLTL